MSATLISDKLKAALLQSAIQGKLTQQRPEDGDARDLLKQIKAEKDRLINEKVIKKEKPLPEITEDEIPFDIPDNWVWVRLGNVGQWGAGATPNRSNINFYKSGTYNWLKTGDLTDGEIFEIPEKITELALRTTSVKLLPKGTVLIAMYGATIGKLGILSVEATTNQACCGCIPFTGVFNKFLFYFLLFNRDNFIAMGAGGAQPNISKEKIINALIPFPPLKEQHRIVEAIETALAKIDKLKVDETKLYNIQKAFPTKLRASLLQSAIQGKLTRQLPEDGDARDLLKQIEAEKERLINEKIIKKEKPLPEITDEEIPFDIPDNWVWVYLQNIVLGTEAGKSPRCETKHVNFNQWGVLTTTSIQKNLFLEDENKILPNSFLINHAIQVKKQDLLITRAGPTNRTGVACVVRDIKYKLILSDKTVRILYVKNKVNPYYLSLFINSEYGIDQVKDLATGMDKQQVNLSQDKIKSLKIALPPLAEQQRIVEMIEMALAKIDKLNKLTE